MTEEVLARSEYQEHAPGFLARLWDYALEWIGRALETVIGVGGRGTVGAVVVLGLAAVLTILILRFASGVRRDAASDPALGSATGRAPREWLAEAEEHEAAGRWREALRCRYRLLLARLAEQGLVDEVPGRTSGEYLAEALRAVPAAALDLREVTAAFERVWYGRRTAEREHVRQVAQAVDRISRLGRAGRERAGAVAGRGPGEAAR